MHSPIESRHFSFSDDTITMLNHHLFQKLRLIGRNKFNYLINTLIIICCSYFHVLTKSTLSFILSCGIIWYCCIYLEFEVLHPEQLFDRCSTFRTYWRLFLSFLKKRSYIHKRQQKYIQSKIFHTFNLISRAPTNTVQNIFASSNYLVRLPMCPSLPQDLYVDLQLVCSDILDMLDVFLSKGQRNSDGRDENNRATTGACQFPCNPPGRWSSKKLSTNPFSLESRGASDSCWELLHRHRLQSLSNSGHYSGETGGCGGSRGGCSPKWWGGILEEKRQHRRGFHR